MRFAWAAPLVMVFCVVWTVDGDDKAAGGYDKPRVVELWPGKVPDETGDIGAEKFLMSPNAMWGLAAGGIGSPPGAPP